MLEQMFKIKLKKNAVLRNMQWPSWILIAEVISMKKNSVLLASAFLLALTAHSPLAQSLEDSCTIGSFKVVAVSGGIMVLWLIPFGVAIGDGPYAYEQFCPDNGGAYCCPTPTHNGPEETTNASTTQTTSTTMPNTCVFQARPWGSCSAGNTLYCPGQKVPAPIRKQAWVNPLMISSAVIWASAATTMLISLLVGSISACHEMCT